MAWWAGSSPRPSTKTDRLTELNEKSLAGNKFLLPKIFATLHLRALPEIFVLHYYFSPGNASVLIDAEKSPMVGELSEKKCTQYQCTMYLVT